MRLLAAALLLPVAAAAQPKAPPPPPPDAPPETITPAQEAAQEMIIIYEEFCLTRFPNADAVQQGVAAHHLTVAPAQQTKDALLGRNGEAWNIVTPKGRYTLAVAARPHQGCVVTGPGADDAGIRAAFQLAVESFAQAHEYGMLQQPPLQKGQFAGHDATLQLIGATPSGWPRQAFVNMQSQLPDGAELLRLTREFAPPAQ